MKTVKTLNIIGGTFGVIWIISVFALVILMILKAGGLVSQSIAESLSNYILLPFGTFWAISFGLCSSAVDKEISLMRKSH